ncbi:MAG: translation initiation factor IF-5A [Hadesarchaea archaeon]|nr:translation initiation factor IF-5A [Hadesarchaea archaeon]
MEKEMVEIGKLKKGRFIIVDDEPCRIINMSSSAPGKHGHAKYKVDVIGIFDGHKRTVVKPSGAKVEVPIIERSTAQVLAVMENSAQLMDLSTYETFELPVPMELRGEIKEGSEVVYIQALGRRKIEQLKG